MRPISAQPAIAQISPASDIDEHQDPVGADAGEPRGLRVVADGVDVAAPRRAVEHVPDSTANSASISSEP